jgi:hypothetical protein
LKALIISRFPNIPKKKQSFFDNCTQLFTHPMALAVKEFLIPLAVCFDVYDNPLI